jgi:glutamine amidotransferase-like uncharacterized protein
MTKWSLILIFLFLSPWTWASKDKSSNGKIALVYKGLGSCADACAEAAAEIPASLGYQIKYVSPDEIAPEIFKGAVLWIQPGGNAIDASNAIGTLKLALIRNFIKKGGAYVGFCAGAFLADSTVDDEGKVEGLGIIPVTTYDAPIDSNNDLGTMVWINWQGVNRHIYFNGGGGFNILESNPQVQVLGRFKSDGEAVTIQTKFGRGKVVVTGAHPEASYVWKVQGGLVDEDNSDYDLARDMVTRATSK